MRISGARKSFYVIWIHKSTISQFIYNSMYYLNNNSQMHNMNNNKRNKILKQIEIIL